MNILIQMSGRIIYNFIFKIYHNIKLNKNDKKYLK